MRFRFWPIPTSGSVALLAWFALITICLLGCRGQEIQGAWSGPFPLDGGEDSVLQLRGDGSFQLDGKGPKRLGAMGKYRFRSNRLRLTFTLLGREGEVKKTLPNPIEFSIEPGGNQLVATEIGSRQTFRWVRKMPRT